MEEKIVELNVKYSLLPEITSKTGRESEKVLLD